MDTETTSGPGAEPDGFCGLDGYGRYVVRGGGRLLVEPWPYRRPVRFRLAARVEIVRWFWGTRTRRHLWKY